jgi:hypothetical protein
MPDRQSTEEVLARTDEELAALSGSVNGLRPADGEDQEPAERLRETYRRLAALGGDELDGLTEQELALREQLLDLQPRQRDAVFGFPQGHGPHPDEDDDDEDGVPQMCGDCRARLGIAAIRGHFRHMIQPWLDELADNRPGARHARRAMDQVLDDIEDLIDIEQQGCCS